MYASENHKQNLNCFPRLICWNHWPIPYHLIQFSHNKTKPITVMNKQSLLSHHTSGFITVYLRASLSVLVECSQFAKHLCGMHTMNFYQLLIQWSMGFTSIISELLTLQKKCVILEDSYLLLSAESWILSQALGYLIFFLLGFKLSKDKTSALFILVLLNVLVKFMAYCG